MPAGPFGSAGSSTVVQPVGPQTKPTILTRAREALTRVQFTVQSLTSPEELFRVLSAIQTNVAAALRPLAEDPGASSVYLRGIVFAAGQTLYLSHGLGRAYAGWQVTRALGAAASFVEAALPTGVTSALILPLTSANAGTYDLRVF